MHSLYDFLRTHKNREVPVDSSSKIAPDWRHPVFSGKVDRGLFTCCGVISSQFHFPKVPEGCAGDSRLLYRGRKWREVIVPGSDCTQGHNSHRPPAHVRQEVLQPDQTLPFPCQGQEHSLDVSLKTICLFFSLKIRLHSQI